jgi:hypothetical protein
MIATHELNQRSLYGVAAQLGLECTSFAQWENIDDADQAKVEELKLRMEIQVRDVAVQDAPAHVDPAKVFKINPMVLKAESSETVSDSSHDNPVEEAKTPIVQAAGKRSSSKVTYSPIQDLSKRKRVCASSSVAFDDNIFDQIVQAKEAPPKLEAP